MKFLASLLLSLVPLTALAQIEVPAEVEPYSPIIASCSISTKADAESQVTWRTSSDSVKFEQVPNSSTLHIWAPPGDHWIEATVATQTFREIVVLVPDPEKPDDLTKAKAEKVKIALAFTINRYTGNFKVKGAAPVVPVTPVTPVTPITPVDVPSQEMQTLMAPIKQVMLKGDPAKAALWGSIWSDMLFTVKTSSPLKTTGAFKSFSKSFMNAAASKAGLENAFPGFTAAMDAAFAARFGADPDAAIDWNKAIEFVAATVWATTSK